MIALWRIGLAVLCAVSAYFLTQTLLEMLINTVRRRVRRRARWLGDLQRFVLVYLSWILILLVLIFIATVLLELDWEDGIVQSIYYLMAIPVVLGTFALRKVFTNVFVRHFKWERGSSEYDSKIFVVTQVITAISFILIIVEIFYIFFNANELASFFLVELFFGILLIMLLSGFTTLKNISTGLFLIFAEPFRTGSYCQLLHLRGYIDKVTLARTTMRRRDGSIVYIPNGIFADCHQTNRSTASGYCRFQVVICLQPSTTMQQIQLVRAELCAVLPEFAAAITEAPSGPSSVYSTAMTPTSVPVVPHATIRRNSSSDISTVSQEGTHVDGVRPSFMSISESCTPPKELRVVLCDMYSLEVTLAIDMQRHSSREAARTEINLSIIEVLQKHGVVPCSIR